MLLLVAAGEVLGMSLWFSATAAAPSMVREFGLQPGTAAWLTMAVQAGFVAGTLITAVTNLADAINARRLFAIGCVLGAASNFAITRAGSPAAIVALRFCTGASLAWVYPPGMKIAAGWFLQRRGTALGIVVGAVTVGSAIPHLLAWLVAGLPWRAVVGTSSLLALIGAAIVAAGVSDGPYVSASAPFDRHALRVVIGNRGARLAMLGYFGHMWELYALWTWLSMFVAAGREARGDTTASTGFIAFAAIGVAGVVGSLLGGWASDRFGRPPAAVAALVISGTCCVASPLFFAAPTVVLVVFVLVWGAAVIADSGVFSTALSETTDARFVGTALTAQTATGFLLTVVTIQLVPVVAELIGWQYAFLLLAPGPLLGAVAMSALHNHRQLKEQSNDYQLYAHDTVRRSDSAALTHCR